MAPISNEAVEMNTIETSPLHSATIETVEASFVETPVAVPVYKAPCACTHQADSSGAGPCEQDKGVTWTTAIFLAIFHAGAIATFFSSAGAPLPFSSLRICWRSMWASAMCHHRLLTHAPLQGSEMGRLCMAILPPQPWKVWTDVLGRHPPCPSPIQ